MNVEEFAQEHDLTHVLDRAYSFHPHIKAKALLVPVTWNYSLKSTAGRATAQWIELHPGLLTEGPEAVRSTFLHELAHTNAMLAFGRNGKGHGEAWATMMHQLGRPAVRLHNYDACRRRKTITLEDLGL